MKPRTKTAALIMSVHPDKFKPRSETGLPHPKPQSPPQSTHNTQLLSFCQAYSLVLHPQIQADTEHSLSLQFAQLQKQNYRLIEANYTLLGKFAETMERIRRGLMGAVGMLEGYYYPEAMREIYGVLDLMRKVEGEGSRLVEESKTFSRNRGSSSKVKQFQPDNSIVSEYQVQPRQAPRLHKLQIHLTTNQLYIPTVKPAPQQLSSSLPHYAQSLPYQSLSHYPQSLAYNDMDSRLSLPPPCHFPRRCEQQSAMDDQFNFDLSVHEGRRGVRVHIEESHGRKSGDRMPHSDTRLRLGRESAGGRRGGGLETGDMHQLLLMQAVAIEQLLL